MSTQDEQDHAERSLYHWIAQGACPHCGEVALVGYLDGAAKLRTCYACGKTDPVTVREP